MNLMRDGDDESHQGYVRESKINTKFIHNHAFGLKLRMNHTHGCDLVKQSKSKYAAPFVTPENILLEKDSVEKMFTSSDWNTSTWASREEGEKLTDLVTYCSFWSDVKKVMNAPIPLCVFWIN